MTDEEVEVVARTMRDAYAAHDGGGEPVPWDRASGAPKRAWRVCARAAITALDAYREEKVG